MLNFSVCCMGYRLIYIYIGGIRDQNGLERGGIRMPCLELIFFRTSLEINYFFKEFPSPFEVIKSSNKSLLKIRGIILGLEVF